MRLCLRVRRASVINHDSDTICKVSVPIHFDLSFAYPGTGLNVHKPSPFYLLRVNQETIVLVQGKTKKFRLGASLGFNLWSNVHSGSRLCLLFSSLFSTSGPSYELVFALLSSISKLPKTFCVLSEESKHGKNSVLVKLQQFCYVRIFIHKN